MNNQFKDDIKALKEKFLDGREDAIETIKNWEKIYKTAMLKKEFAKNIVVQRIMKDCQRKLNALDNILRFDDNLSLAERDKIFARKESYNWFLDIFKIANKTVTSVESEIKANLYEE